MQEVVLASRLINKTRVETNQVHLLSAFTSNTRRGVKVQHELFKVSHDCLSYSMDIYFDYHAPLPILAYLEKELVVHYSLRQHLLAGEAAARQACQWQLRHQHQQSQSKQQLAVSRW